VTTDRAAACRTLAEIFLAAAHGDFPPSDGKVTLLSQPSDRDAGVVSFTAHSVVFTDADPDWVLAQLPADDLGAPLSPRFLQTLADRTGRDAHQSDMLACASALPGPPPLDLTEVTDLAHPRIARALNYRNDVRAWSVLASRDRGVPQGSVPQGGGVVLLGRGLAGRWETAIEVDPDCRGRGLGRLLATAARHVIPPGETVWAQISPGNAASVRAFCAAGFRPAAAEALLTSPR
jgi:GNAT superfamily N-acetyltransferase